MKTNKNFIYAPMKKVSIKILILLKSKNLISSFFFRNKKTPQVVIFLPSLPSIQKTQFFLMKRVKNSFRFSNKALSIFHQKMGETLILIETTQGILPLSVALNKRLGGVIYGLFL
jgi:ribosomal protein S8